MLDVGLPLDAPDDEGEREGLLTAVPSFRELDDSLLGILVSHPHVDHYGLARYVRPDVPVYIGKDAHNILVAASRYRPAYSLPQLELPLDKRTRRSPPEDCGGREGGSAGETRGHERVDCREEMVRHYRAQDHGSRA